MGRKTTINVVTDADIKSALQDVPPAEELNPIRLEPGESVTIANGAVTVTRGTSSGAVK